MKVQNAMLQISGVCNFRCEMCGHASENKGLMKRDIFERALQSCKDYGIHTIIFAGPWGEPLLHPGWREYLSHSVDNDFTTILSTNGSKLTHESIDFLAYSGIKTLQISFAGYNKHTYESVYINGDFNKISDILVYLKRTFLKHDTPPDILVNGVILQHQQETEYVNRTYRFLYQIGYEDHEINMVRPNNFGGKHLNRNSAIKKDLLQNKYLAVCSVLKDVIGIYHDGAVSACACLDNDRKMVVGHICESSIEGIRQGDKFKDIAKCFENKNLTSLEMCSKCDVPYGSERNEVILPSLP